MRTNKVTIYILIISLIASIAMSIIEHKKLSFFENKFGAYESLVVAQNRADRYAMLKEHPIVAYIKRDVSEDRILEFKESLRDLAGVEGVEYISSDQALENFRSAHPCTGIEPCNYSLSDSPLRASLVIVFNDQSQKEIMTSLIKANDIDSIVENIEIPR
ncbi:MAG: permease-like cell division protein FtsX [bacterium]|nr:permease-like cell division protein FtsX [bacterium]